MGNDVVELTYWVRKWSTINDGLLGFSKNSHALHPFDLPCKSNSRVPSTTIATPHHSNTNEKKEENEKLREEWNAAAGSRNNTTPHDENTNVKDEAACVDVKDIEYASVLHVHVYRMLATYGRVEFWSNVVILQHMLASSLRAWVAHLCASSGDCLLPGPGAAMDELQPARLSWTAAMVDSLWEQALLSNGESWAVAAAARLPGSSGGSSGDGEGGDGAVEHTAALHALAAFAMHYHRMRWLLRVVFLQVDIGMNDIVWCILRSAVSSMLQFNSAKICATLCCAAERCVNEGLSQITDAPQECAILPRPYSSDSMPQESHIWRSDLRHAVQILAMLDDCLVDRVTVTVAARVAELCERHGEELARTHIAPLCAPEGGGAAAEALADVAHALQQCMAAYHSRRAAAMRFFCGSARHAEDISALGRQRVALAMRAFIRGFCRGGLLLDFAAVWALPLWLRACEAHERHVRCHDAAAAAAAAEESASALSVLLPLDGFTALIFFLDPSADLLAAFESRLAAGIARHLDARLAAAPVVPSLRTLPRNVWQHCVCALRATGEVLEPVAGCRGAYAALRAVRKGLQTFFAAREPCAIRTLASALHAQTTRGARGVRLDVVDTILELVALLGAKDVFVECYCGLLAPRLIAARRAEELKATVELVARLAVRLGDALAAGPQALLRDVAASLADPCAAVTAPRLTQIQPQARPLILLLLSQPLPLLQQAHVLCCARWERYAPVALSAAALRRCHAEGQWLHPALLRAVEDFEQRYSAAAERTSAPAPRSDDEDMDSNTNSSDSTSHSHSNNSHSIDSSDGGGSGDCAVATVAVRQRQLAWSLGSGALTIACRGPQDAKAHVRLVAPPAALLVLQALARYGGSGFDALHQRMPVEVPRALFGALLSALVRHRIATRTRAPNGGVVYGLAPSLAVGKCGQCGECGECGEEGPRHVVVDAAVSLRQWGAPHPREGAGGAATAEAVNGIVDVERMKKLEVGIVRAMKSRRALSHVELFDAVKAQLQQQFVVTAVMLKRCIEMLIDREFIAREGKDMYVYVT